MIILKTLLIRGIYTLLLSITESNTSSLITHDEVYIAKPGFFTKIDKNTKGLSATHQI